MKIIPPYKISSEILNLINQAEKYVVLVSPYVNFRNWGAIKQEIDKALKRGIKIEFFTRFDVDNNKSWEQINELGIQPKLVKNLHAKLYYNEKCGIVTSMNLLTSSNLSAIEFGTIFNTSDEVNELKYFVKHFLFPHVEKELPSDDDIYLSKEKFIIVLENSLSNMMGKHCNCRWNKGQIQINANNQFTVGIDKVNKCFYINGIISENESQQIRLFINEFEKHFSNYNCKFNQSPDDLPSVSAIYKNALSSDNFNYLNVIEKKEIINTALNFIGGLLNFKEECYKNRKNGSS